MNKAMEVKATLTAALAGMTALWGWMGWLVLLWVVCMALDYISGSVAAMRGGGWKSDVAREGIYHKGGMVLTVAVALLADLLIGLVVGNIPGLPLPFDYGVLVAPMVLVWYVITELGSIVENAAKLGAPVPPWLVKFLATVEDAADAAGDKLDGYKDNEKEIER